MRRHTANGDSIFKGVATERAQIGAVDAIELLFEDFKGVESSLGGFAQTLIHRGGNVLIEMPVGVAGDADEISASRAVFERGLLFPLRVCAGIELRRADDCGRGGRRCGAKEIASRRSGVLRHVARPFQRITRL